MRLAAAVGRALVIVCLWTASAAAQTPSLSAVLERVGAYVTEFERRLSGIVAEEHYVQDVLTFTKRRGCPGDATQAGTMIRTTQRKDLPARGRFWIEPDTGRVLMSELLAFDRNIRATIDVSYQSEPLLGCLVPIEMREDYHHRRGSHVIGAAAYGRFRQFQVNVDERFLIKK